MRDRLLRQASAKNISGAHSGVIAPTPRPARASSRSKHGCVNAGHSTEKVGAQSPLAIWVTGTNPRKCGL